MLNEALLSYSEGKMWEIVSQLVKNESLRIRVVLRDGTASNWGKFIILPAPGYCEIDGPVRYGDVEFLEIDSIEYKKIGRLVPDKKIDHSNAIINELNSNSIKFIRNENIFKIIP
jgi:hypothetical protein